MSISIRFYVSNDLIIAIGLLELVSSKYIAPFVPVSERALAGSTRQHGTRSGRPLAVHYILD